MHAIAIPVLGKQDDEAASNLARDVLEDKPLYTFTAEDFAKYGARYAPGRVEVRADALVLRVK